MKTRFSTLSSTAALATTLATALLVTSPAQAGWRDRMKEIVQSETVQKQVNQTAASSEMVAGFKEALAQGVTKSINQLGKTDGFLKNPLVKIEPPASLDMVAKGLRRAGQGAVVDEFTTSMNRAAEKAVPHVADIFGDAIRGLSIADAQTLMSGGDTAITDFFKGKTWGSLQKRVKPLVAEQTSKVGVTQQYKQLMKQAGPLTSLFGQKTTDIDSYVTDSSLDGLFTLIGKEEANIRANQAARGTQILKDVFGK